MSALGSTAAQGREAGAGWISPARVRTALERLGPTFVKIGQFLALRPDLVGQAYCDEFLRLTDQATPFPFAAARQIVEEDLSGRLEAHFAWFNPRPLASASLAQVHLAATPDGAQVAVKVLRPDIRERVERDLRRAKILSWLIAATRGEEVISPRLLVEELGRWLHEELDLRHELRNLSRMHDLARDVSSMRVPRPYPALCGARVLTAEYLPGVPLTEILRLVRSSHPERADQLGLNRRELAENLLETVLIQIFRFRFFHADTHPGNLLAMSGNVVGFVDFGLADELDPAFRQGMLRYLAAVYAGDVEGMFHGLTEVLIPTTLSDRTKFRGDFFEESRRWRQARARTVGRESRDDSPTARYLVGVLRAARLNHYHIPPTILSMYRALLTAETLAAQLGGVVDLPGVGNRVFRRLQLEAVTEALSVEKLQATLVNALQLTRDGPGQVRRLLADVADGRFVVTTRTVDSDEDRRRANDRALLVSAAVVSVGLCVLIAATRDAVLPGGIRLGAWLWGMLVLDWVCLLLLWRRLT